MREGTPFGGDRAHYFEQTKSAFEATIRAIKAEVRAKLIKAGVDRQIAEDATRGYLESCGMASMVNCSLALLEEVPYVSAPGGASVPLVDLAMGIINLPATIPQIAQVIPGYSGDTSMENRIMRIHPLACQLVFGGLVEGTYVTGLGYDDVVKVIREEQRSVGIHLPGHYVAGVLVEDGVMLINDSWGGRKPEWAGDGFNRPLPRDEFATAHDEFVIYKPARRFGRF